jgi:hypothetical protein
VIACLLALGGAIGILLGHAGVWLDRKHRNRQHFKPLPELPPRSVTRWPPKPVHVIEEPVLRDAEVEGWWS